MTARFFLLLCALLGLVSCNGGFEREWAAAAAPASHPLAGRWQGRWHSASTGHSGALRCVTQPGPQPGSLAFHYHARWGRIFSGSFRLAAAARQASPGQWELEGGKDLGQAMGGSFQHTARATAKRITAEYRALGDRGTFELTRP